MKINHILIENWRSIKSISFSPSDITILVGANNAGKTNILSAINFILGERWPMPGNLDERDYYGSDIDAAIRICLFLDHPAYSKVDFDTSRSQYTLQAFDRRGVVVRGFNNLMREEIAFAYVDAARNFERQFSTSRWSLFGQALRQLHGTLRSNEEQLNRLKEVLSSAHDLLRTDLYTTFERELRDAFAAQLRTARYDVNFDFRTLDESNLYRSLYPVIMERGTQRNPSDVGSGVRNLLVLALFQAFAKSFRGGAILGIEEPELYLHPHAQRSLMRQFEEICQQGNQIFISSHSDHFLDIVHSDRIVLVERCEDQDDEVCTQVKTTSFSDILTTRRAFHPSLSMDENSLRAFIRNISSSEMTEAYFSRLVIIVEGPSEREALPIYAKHLGLDFDEHGISTVSSNGKQAIDLLSHLYQAHGIRTYTVFDNDEGASMEDRQPNRTLCRLLGLTETDLPAPIVAADYAILRGNWERQSKEDLDKVHSNLYSDVEQQARSELHLRGSRNKPLVARHIAQNLCSRDIVPQFVTDIIVNVKNKLPD